MKKEETEKLVLILLYIWRRAMGAVVPLITLCFKPFLLNTVVRGTHLPNPHWARQLSFFSSPSTTVSSPVIQNPSAMTGTQQNSASSVTDTYIREEASLCSCQPAGAPPGWGQLAHLALKAGKARKEAHEVHRWWEGSPFLWFKAPANHPHQWALPNRITHGPREGLRTSFLMPCATHLISAFNFDQSKQDFSGRQWGRKRHFIPLSNL